MKEDIIYKSIGKKIKFLREKRGITQEKLAEKAGLSLDFIGKIEVNINKPGLRSLIKIANALDIPIKEIFDKDIKGSNPVVKKRKTIHKKRTQFYVLSLF